MTSLKFLPETGRGTARSVVEGVRLFTQRCVRLRTPSVSRFASATTPLVGRI